MVDERSDPGLQAGELRSWLAEVIVEPKAGVNDPQGEAIFGGLRSLGYVGVTAVRSGRFFRIRLQAADAESARAAAAAMCDQLLANPVIETYAVSLVEDLDAEGVLPLDQVAGGRS
jgi:phosphoribosylformylglycinamidine synthase